MENYTPEKAKELCMARFILGNTLSDNGTVTRGICAVDENDYLTDVIETYEIKKTSDGAESQGNRIDVNAHVSMNMWGLTPEFVGLLEEGFVEFFENIKGDEAKELKGEYLLPIYIDELLKKGKVSVRLLETKDKWFGVTYKEDKPVVVESFAKLIADELLRGGPGKPAGRSSRFPGGNPRRCSPGIVAMAVTFPKWVLGVQCLHQWTGYGDPVQNQRIRVGKVRAPGRAQRPGINLIYN